MDTATTASKVKKPRTAAVPKALIVTDESQAAVTAPTAPTKKPRAPMTEEAKAAAAAKRAATKAAKASVTAVAATEPTATEPTAAKAAKAVKVKEPKAAKEPKAKAVKAKEPTAAKAADAPAASPKRLYELVDVEGAFFMVSTVNQKAYRANLALDGDERALLDQQVGIFKDNEILPIFDDEEETA